MRFDQLLGAVFFIAGAIPMVKGNYVEGLLAFIVGLLFFIADYLEQIIKELKKENEK